MSREDFPGFRALPGWLESWRATNARKRDLHDDRWGLVVAALVLGLALGIVGTTAVWSNQVDQIVQERVTRAASVRP